MELERPSKADAAAMATLQATVPKLKKQVGQFIADLMCAMESQGVPPMCPIFGFDIQIVAQCLTHLGFLAYAAALSSGFDELTAMSIHSIQAKNTDDPEVKPDDFLLPASLFGIVLERIEGICGISVAASEPKTISAIQRDDDGRPQVAEDSVNAPDATDTKKKKSKKRKRLPRPFGKLHRECGLAYKRASRIDPSQTLKSFAKSWLIDNSQRFKKPPSDASFYKALCDNRSQWDSGHPTDNK